MAFMFENLEVYQKSVNLADQVIDLTKMLPQGYYFLSEQLNRAILSIATNIAEGNGRFTKADRKHFFVIARGSVQECIPLLDIAHRKNLINETTHDKFRNELEAIAKMIGGLIRGLDKRNQSR